MSWSLLESLRGSLKDFLLLDETARERKAAHLRGSIRSGLEARGSLCGSASLLYQRLCMTQYCIDIQTRDTENTREKKSGSNFDTSVESGWWM